LLKYSEREKKQRKSILMKLKDNMRKRTIDEIKKREFLKMSELAELNGVRYSTIKGKGANDTRHYKRLN